MEKAKKDNTANASEPPQVKKGEELIAVLKEILADNSKIIETQEAIKQELASQREILKAAIPPSPGKYTRC